MNFNRTAFPKNFKTDNVSEAARDRTASWMFTEQTTGSPGCAQAS